MKNIVKAFLTIFKSKPKWGKNEDLGYTDSIEKWDELTRRMHDSYKTPKQ